VQLLGSQARDKGVLLALDHELGEVPALGDPLRIRQVLLNLIGNALKFTPEGGVTVRARALPGGPDRCAMRVEVVDTGVGIAPEAVGRLFSDFVQAESSTARRFGGTGLGLSISKQLVELMGGRIGVDSTPGQGSTFWFELDLPAGKTADVRAAAEAQAAARDAVVTRDGVATRVLVAEDNRVNQAVVRLLLKRAGCEAVVVENGREVLERLAAEPFDLVLMDCHMPELDGYEATRAVRALASDLRSVPIVALTANAMEQDRLACLAAGMDDHLAKPIELERLNEVLRHWVGRRSQACERPPGAGDTRS
jgi:CheY-like chemotaxis protein